MILTTWDIQNGKLESISTALNSMELFNDESKTTSASTTSCTIYNMSTMTLKNNDNNNLFPPSMAMEEDEYDCDYDL